MKNQHYPILLALGAVTPVGQTLAAEDGADTQGIEVIEVTARKRVETLQDVPDAVTAFSEADIESARIENVSDFVNLTPNVMFRKTFRAGASYITMRGITGTQQGLPPVTYVVDGVQVGAADFINQDMGEIQRIEVLRGPQGALYGAGAMAGAINVITKQPTQDLSGKFKVQYAEGNDISANGYLSGGVNEDVYGLISVGIRDSDGLINSADGRDMDFNDTRRVKTRWQYLGENLEADLRLGYAKYEQGAVMQDLVPIGSDINSFSESPKRSFIGKENQEFKDASLKLDYSFDDFTLTWISAYQDAEQDLIGDLDWSEANIFLQDLADNFDVTSHELRVTSNSDSALRWLGGIYYQKRDSFNKLNIRLEPTPGEIGASIFQQTDTKQDTIKAAFAQLNYDITDNVELTLAARYDKIDFSTYRPLTEAVTYLDTNGNPISQLSSSDSEFQPKASISWDITADTMLYATYAAGFRPGFYNTGSITKAETTNNYEIGGKSMWWENRLQLNGAIFYIDYSEQQFSTIVSEAPFRAVENIDATKIKGLELEGKLLLTEDLLSTLSYGYTDSEISGGIYEGFSAPVTPKNTFNLGLQYTRDISDWVWSSRIDYRYQGDFFLDRREELNANSVQYLNINTSFEWQEWRFSVFAENLLDEYTITDATFIPADQPLLGVVSGTITAFTPGRQIGASVEYKF